MLDVGCVAHSLGIGGKGTRHPRHTFAPLTPSTRPSATVCQVTMCCRTLLDPEAREVLKPTLLELCRESFKQLLDKEKAAQAKQVSRDGGK